MMRSKPALFRYFAKVLSVVALGALGGFLYYRFVGCVSGACPLSSDPLRSTLYGAGIGLILAWGFVRRPNQVKSDR